MKIREYRGYEIEYEPAHKRFYALKDGDRITEAENQKMVEEEIDRLIKAGFKRIPVIHWHYESTELGEITSIKESTGHYGQTVIEVWFVNESKEKSKLWLGNLYHATAENLGVHEQIVALNKQKEELTKQIEKLHVQLKDRITTENVYKMAGWK